MLTHTCVLLRFFVLLAFIYLICKTGLTNTANSDDTPDKIKQAAKGALWVLEGKDEQQRTSCANGRSD